jgi:ribonucleoside-diphosphate reductase beta chain
MTPDDIKNYIRYIADWRLAAEAGADLWYRPSTRLPWLTEILNGVEHANFFEQRATEYSKGATKGDWHGEDGVWTNFDQRRTRTFDMDLTDA